MNNTEKSVQCSFCNNEYLASAIGEHLMLCGNKTDQCPKCEKYIRRAIFAYHYENNCANLDETDRVRSSTASTTRDDNKITIRTINLGQFSAEQRTPISSHVDSGSLLFSVCPYCNHECEIADAEKHRNICLWRPKNATRPAQSHTNSTIPHNAVQYDLTNQFNDSTDIPCEYCDKVIKSYDYLDHMEHCDRHYRSMNQQQSQQVFRAEDSAMRLCSYCHHHFRTDCMRRHESLCPNNPSKINLEEQYRCIYHLPPLPRVAYL